MGRMIMKGMDSRMRGNDGKANTPDGLRRAALNGNGLRLTSCERGVSAPWPVLLVRVDRDCVY